MSGISITVVHRYVYVDENNFVGLLCWNNEEIWLVRNLIRVVSLRYFSLSVLQERRILLVALSKIILRSKLRVEMFVRALSVGVRILVVLVLCHIQNSVKRF